jgi:hypothetical protein
MIAEIETAETAEFAEVAEVVSHFAIETHNGIITVENPARGTHRTFRIETQPADAKFAPGERILSLLIGADNEADYLGIGFVKDDGRVFLWKRYQTEQHFALARVLQKVEHFKSIGLVYHFEGRCRKCNRVLTTPESIKSGIGPTCAKRR